MYVLKVRWYCVEDIAFHVDIIYRVPRKIYTWLYCLILSRVSGLPGVLIHILQGCFIVHGAPLLGQSHHCMMTSSNGNIFRVTGPLCGEFTGPGKFPTQRPVTRSFDVLFDLRLNKRLSKQPWGWWFETPSWSLWRQRNGPSRWINPGENG